MFGKQLSHLFCQLLASPVVFITQPGPHVASQEAIVTQVCQPVQSGLGCVQPSQPLLAGHDMLWPLGQSQSLQKELNGGTLSH